MSERLDIECILVLERIVRYRTCPGVRKVRYRNCPMLDIELVLVSEKVRYRTCPSVRKG